MSWSLVNCKGEEGAQGKVAVLTEEGGIVDAPVAGTDDLLGLIEEWSEHEPELRSFDPGTLLPRNGDRGHVLAPLRFPRKLIMVGANYYGHLAEMGIDRPEPGGAPFFFLKPPTTTIIGDGDAIELPDDPSYAVDWEAELGIVIGRVARDVSEDDAFDYLAGYTILNDISARGLHRRDDAIAAPFSFDWLGSKGRDTFCPMGPGITPRWLVPDPQQLAIKLWVNDELKQDSSTEDMIFDIPTVIAAASRSFTLEPGDVIGTGTPAGVGRPSGESLHPGDEVRVRIEGLGELRNPVTSRGR